MKLSENQKRKLNKAWDVVVYITIFLGLSFLVLLVWFGKYL